MSKISQQTFLTIRLISIELNTHYNYNWFNTLNLVHKGV